MGCALEFLVSLAVYYKEPSTDMYERAGGGLREWRHEGDRKHFVSEPKKDTRGARSGARPTAPQAAKRRTSSVRISEQAIVVRVSTPYFITEGAF